MPLINAVNTRFRRSADRSNHETIN